MGDAFELGLGVQSYRTDHDLLYARLRPDIIEALPLGASPKLWVPMVAQSGCLYTISAASNASNPQSPRFLTRGIVGARRSLVQLPSRFANNSRHALARETLASKPLSDDSKPTQTLSFTPSTCALMARNASSAALRCSSVSALPA